MFDINRFVQRQTGEPVGEKGAPLGDYGLAGTETLRALEEHTVLDDTEYYKVIEANRLRKTRWERIGFNKKNLAIAGLAAAGTTLALIAGEAISPGSGAQIANTVKDALSSVGGAVGDVASDVGDRLGVDTLRERGLFKTPWEGDAGERESGLADAVRGVSDGTMSSEEFESTMLKYDDQGGPLHNLTHDAMKLLGFEDKETTVIGEGQGSDANEAPIGVETVTTVTNEALNNATKITDRLGKIFTPLIGRKYLDPAYQYKNAGLFRPLTMALGGALAWPLLGPIRKYRTMFPERSTVPLKEYEDREMAGKMWDADEITEAELRIAREGLDQRRKWLNATAQQVGYE